MAAPAAARSTVAPAGAAVGTAAAAGSSAADAGGTVAQAGLATLLAALVAFLGLLREAHRRFLLRELGSYGHADDVARVIAGEMRREQAFADASVARVRAGLARALEIADPGERRSAVRAVFEAEKRYAQQRSEAMAARAIAAMGRLQLRRDSPLGAFWKLGIAKDHTEGCKFMAGRFWPWEVLDRVYPPRHHGCTSSLHGFGEAVHSGWMTAGDVLDVPTAVRLASGVTMEPGMAESLLAELAVRGLLIEAGVDREALAAIDLEGVR